MTAADLTSEQAADLTATLGKLRHDGRGTLADALQRAIAGEHVSSADQVRLHVYADYCDRSGFRDRRRALEVLLS